MKIKIAAVIAAISLMLVGGCSNPHKNMHCVQSHDETYFVNTGGKYPVLIPEHDTVCDKWVPNSK